MADLKAAGAVAGNEAVDLLAGADGFAEVYPEDKYIVVQHLQAAGHVTGMTGDGVNDAPALRQAEVGIAVSTATDVAKGAASVVLTEAGLTNIVTLVEQGRTIYQRILTWIINKISRTILKAAFVAIAFVVTGKFVVSAFAMLLLVFLTDFAKISLATDNVRPSKKPETWNIGGFITVSVVLGIAMVAETLFLLWIGWTKFGLATNNNALYTFSFLMLLYFAVFSVVSARERHWFWATLPSKTFLSALAADAIAGTVLTFVGLKGLMPLPWWQTLAVFVYAMVSCLVLNDAVKVAMIKWRVLNVVARNPVNVANRCERMKMKINSKDFRVREGDEVNLRKWPTNVEPVYKSKDQYHKLLAEHVAQLSALQQLLYASNRYALLLIFQAMDAAGKDGAIKHVMSGVNPQGCQVFSFKHPSPAELQHDFLWRTTRDLPERGRIGIFNRSYYEEVLIARVHPEILRSEGLPDALLDEKTVWHDRYRSIANLERHLSGNGTRIIKFFLHLSKEEQRKRFLERIDEPEKNWKFSRCRHRGAEILEGLHEGL